jgi:hypothetical protein
MIDRLPDCRLTHRPNTGAISGRGLWASWIPIFCANCGTDGGAVLEAYTNFAFWLCNNCFEHWGPIANTMVMPDEEYWREVRAEEAARQAREARSMDLIAMPTLYQGGD